MIEFISHDYFPDDQYTKEICYLSIDRIFRFAYTRKAMKDGRLFWAPISAGVTLNGEKKYKASIEWDSNFLAKDIIAFLEARSWENRQPIATGSAMKGPVVIGQPQYEQTSFLDSGEPPF